nr:unnamed protein product [Callosobruchus analis]
MTANIAQISNPSILINPSERLKQYLRKCGGGSIVIRTDFKPVDNSLAVTEEDSDFIPKLKSNSDTLENGGTEVVSTNNSFFVVKKRIKIRIRDDMHQKKKPAVRPDSSQLSTNKVDETEEDVVHESHYDSDSGKSSTTLKKKVLYEHKYKAEWETHEDFRKWIKPSSHGIHHFKYKMCNKDYIGGVAASDKIIKENEIRIASFIAEHNLAINVSDHLKELIKSICLSGMEPSQISKMSCDRTKCTSIINNVIGKTSFERLISKLKVRPTVELAA